MSNHIAKYDNIGCIGTNKFDPSEFTTQLTTYQFPLIVLIVTENFKSQCIQMATILKRVRPTTQIVILSQNKKEMEETATVIKDVVIRTFHIKDTLKISMIDKEVVQVLLTLKNVPTYKTPLTPQPKVETSTLKDTLASARNSATMEMKTGQLVNSFIKDIDHNKRLNEISKRLEQNDLNLSIYNEIHLNLLDKLEVATMKPNKTSKESCEILKREVESKDEGVKLLNQEELDLQEKLNNLQELIKTNPDSPKLLSQIDEVNSMLDTIKTMKETRTFNIVGALLKQLVTTLSERKTEQLTGIEKRIEELKQDKELQETKEGIEKLKQEKQNITDELNVYIKSLQEYNTYIGGITVEACKYLSNSKNNLIRNVNDKIKNNAISKEGYQIAVINTDKTTSELTNLKNINQVSTEMFNEMIVQAKVVIKSLVNIVNISDVIIASQDKVIETLETQGARNVYRMDDSLSTKLCSIVGADGAGKTSTALNLVYSNNLSFLVIDMNIKRPNLHLYKRESLNDWDLLLKYEGLEILDNVVRDNRNIYIDATHTIPYLQQTIGIHSNKIVEEEDVVEEIITRIEVLSEIVDKVIVIHPEEYTLLSNKLIERTGELLALTDTNLHSIRQLSQILGDIDRAQTKIKFRYFVLNKTQNYFNTSSNNNYNLIKEVEKLCGVSKTKYRYMEIPYNTMNDYNKFHGEIPASVDMLFGNNFKIWDD